MTVTDARGRSASKSATVTIGNLTGTWDVTCEHETFPLYPRFPTRFVVSITQSGSGLFGTITGGGLSQSFPAPPGAGIGNGVGNPRGAIFGVEPSFNRWATAPFVGRDLVPGAVHPRGEFRMIARLFVVSALVLSTASVAFVQGLRLELAEAGIKAGINRAVISVPHTELDSLDEPQGIGGFIEALCVCWTRRGL